MGLIAPLTVIRLERQARQSGHRCGSLLRYAQLAFGVERIREVSLGDLPDLEHFVSNPPSEMVEKVPRPSFGKKAPKKEIARRVDKLLQPRKEIL